VADGSLTAREINTYGTAGLAFGRVISRSWGGGRSNASSIPAGGTVTLVYTTTIAADVPIGAFSRTTITDRGGNVIDLWHDGAGHRLRSRQIVAGQVIIYDYTHNADGQITGITYPAGTALTYTYDVLNRVKRIGDAAGTVAAYDYLGPARLWRRTNSNGTFAAYAYEMAHGG
jgi:YD repeat-containing protein